MSWNYRVSARYTRIPLDDDELQNWLRIQPGVVANTVHLKRNGNEIHIIFIMSQNLNGSPPVPDISHECDQLGLGPSSSWQDDEPLN